MKNLIASILVYLKELLTGKKYQADENFEDWSILEQEVAVKLNEFRISKGLNYLVPDKLLWEQAAKRVEYQLDKPIITHNGFEITLKVLRKSGYKRISEILASKFRSVKLVTEAWIGSETHNDIISDKLHRNFGVSVGTDKDGKQIYCVLLGR